MKLVRCQAVTNHFYDSDKYKDCPHCEKLRKEGKMPPAPPAKGKPGKPQQDQNILTRMQTAKSLKEKQAREKKAKEELAKALKEQKKNPPPVKPAPPVEDDDDKTVFMPFADDNAPLTVKPQAANIAKPQEDDDDRTVFMPFSDDADDDAPPTFKPQAASIAKPQEDDDDRTVFMPFADAPTPKPAAAPQMEKPNFPAPGRPLTPPQPAAAPQMGKPSFPAPGKPKYPEPEKTQILITEKPEKPPIPPVNGTPYPQMGKANFPAPGKPKYPEPEKTQILITERPEKPPIPPVNGAQYPQMGKANFPTPGKQPYPTADRYDPSVDAPYRNNVQNFGVGTSPMQPGGAAQQRGAVPPVPQTSRPQFPPTTYSQPLQQTDLLFPQMGMTPQYPQMGRPTYPPQSAAPYSPMGVPTMQPRGMAYGQMGGAQPYNTGRSPGYPIAPNTAPNTAPLSQRLSPVTGWLVYTNTSERGRSLVLKDGKNTIGRGRTFDVCLFGGQNEVKETEAVIYYEALYRKFLFEEKSKTSSVRLNGEIPDGVVTLSAYDKITVGNIELVFMPLCGNDFSWD